MLVMSENLPDISIILNPIATSTPTSEKILEASQKDIHHFFTKLPVQFEILILSKTFSLKTAMLEARGRYCFIMGAELCHPLAEIIVFLTHFYAHPEVQMILGTRTPSKIMYSEKRIERLFRVWSNRFIQKFFVKDIEDALCEFKAFRKDCAKLIFSKQKFSAATPVEVLLLARQLNQKVDILPIRSTSSEAPRKLIDWFKLAWELLLLSRQKNR